MTDPGDDAVQRIAAESLAAGDPTGWFDQLYRAAEQGAAVVPWDLQAPHRMLVEWAQGRSAATAGRRALVVGCGFGRDAEYVAGLGFETVAFDIAETAIHAARRRHPDSAVQYVVADLLDPPAEWRAAFDLVVESMNVQALLDPARGQAISHVGPFVAPGGTLLVIAAGRSGSDDPGEGPPWPLTRSEVEAFATGDLEPVRIEGIRDEQDPSVYRWRAEFRRPLPGDDG
jgi:SAM-dependent methyltransferase